jgi:hypothetical protein
LSGVAQSCGSIPRVRGLAFLGVFFTGLRRATVVFFAVDFALAIAFPSMKYPL